MSLLKFARRHRAATPLIVTATIGEASVCDAPDPAGGGALLDVTAPRTREQLVLILAVHRGLAARALARGDQASSDRHRELARDAWRRLRTVARIRTVRGDAHD